MKKKYNYLLKTVTLPDGTRKYIRGKTQAELYEKLMKLSMELSSGLTIDGEQTFGEYAKLWFETYKVGSVRTISEENYRSLINSHIMPYLASYRMKDIKPSHIKLTTNKWKSLAASSQRKLLGLMGSIFRSAVDDGVVARSPIVSSITITKDSSAKTEILTPEQTQRLLDALIGTTAYTFVMIALNTGMRRGEVLGLQWSEVDFESRMIRVRRELSFLMRNDPVLNEFLKTESSVRDIPMSDDLYHFLLAHRKKSNSFFVVSRPDGTPHTKSSYNSMMRNITRRTVENPSELGTAVSNNSYIIRTLDFPVHAHMLRHTFCTRCFEAGFDIKEVQYLMGHSTPDTTLRIYTHYDKKSRNVATAEKFQQRMGFSASQIKDSAAL